MTCATCDQPLRQHRRGRPRRYCDERCSARAAYLRKKAQETTVVVAECIAPDCDATFERRHGLQKYCSEKCRSRTKEAGRDYSHKRTCPCSVCGELRYSTRSSLPEGELVCLKCRRGGLAPRPSYADVVQLHVRSPGTGKAAKKGLGGRHRQAVAAMKREHKDGDPCFWCGRPMWLDPTRNWDYIPGSRKNGNGVLQGDHVIPRSEYIAKGLPVPLPDRLLHGICNMQRGRGGNDHLAWGNAELLNA